MGLYAFSDQELAKVKRQFPKLELIQPGTWRGTIDFDSTHHEYRIIDSFEIRIKAPAGYPEKIPLVYDVGEQAKKVGAKHGVKNLRDIHFNPSDGTICLCVRQEEKNKFPPGSDLVYFIDRLVIPYFYALHYYDEQGRWPWREYSHGGLGMLEHYAEDTSEQTRDSIKLLASYFHDDTHLNRYKKHLREPKENKECMCENRRPISVCHPLAWTGLLKLHQDMDRLKLNPYKLFRK